MKFGGSSVGDTDGLRAVAQRVAARAQSHPVVVVVSAMGKTTDALVKAAKEISESPSARELDMLLTTGERQSMSMLALAISALGQPAISLTGSQCGIITTHRHGRARVVEVRPFRVMDELALGQVVVVGGFAGVSYKREVTTLGRGGSDTTAVALAAALGADCEIYSDVDGVYSSDPRRVPEALRLEELSFEEMRALSRGGAKVLHAQAVQLAEAADISIFARATDERPGESVVRKRRPERSGVLAVACDPRVLWLRATLDTAEQANALATALSESGLIGLHVENKELGAFASLSTRDDTDQFLARVRDCAPASQLRLREMARVTCVGTGLEDRPEVLAAALDCLRGAKIPWAEFSTDTVSLALLVEIVDADRATKLLHTTLIEGVA